MLKGGGGGKEVKIVWLRVEKITCFLFIYCVLQGFIVMVLCVDCVKLGHDGGQRG